MKLAITVVFVATAVMAGPAVAQSHWTFSLAPYIWLPNINAKLRYEPPPASATRPEVEVGPNDYLENLDFALMIAAEARKGDWAFLTDVIYLDFSDESAAVRSLSGPGGLVQGTLDTGSETSLKALVWQVAASRALSRGPRATFEVLGGVRYVRLETALDWRLAGAAGGLAQSGNLAQKKDLTDAIIGLRGQAWLGAGQWFVPYYLDVGGGSSSLTWQGVAGIGYAFKWGEALLNYRHLYYDQGSDKLVQEMEFSGPAVGVRFRF
jgi:hypothetical protein